MTRRVLAVLLALAMVFALALTACGTEEAEKETSKAAESKETTKAAEDTAKAQEPAEAQTIHWYSSTSAGVNENFEEVSAYLNAYFQEKVNTTVVFHWDGTDYTSRMSAALMAGTDIDMLYLKESSTGFYIWYQRNALLALDDLLAEYAADYYAACPDYMWDGCKIDGQIYIMKTNKDLCVDIGIFYNENMLNDLGMADSFEAVDYENAADFDDFFYALKDARDTADPALSGIPVIEEYTTLHAYFKGDVVSGPIYSAIPGLKSFSGYGDGSTVFDVYETTDYSDAIQMISRWVNDGIMPYDASNYDSEGTNYEYGYEFGQFEWGNVCAVEGKYEAWNECLRHPKYSFASCTSMQSGNSLRAGTSDEIQAACMKVFNIVCQDPMISTSVRFGVPETYWKLGTDELGNSRAMFEGTKNADATDRAYYYWYLSELGNLFTVYLPEGQDADFFDELRAMNANGVGSSNMGFMLDTSPIDNELAAVSNVVGEYNADLILGMFEDPGARLDEFAQAMQGNGIETVISEAQAQLDAWRG